MTDAPSRQLLLVDDDEAKRYVLATWLRRAGHTVIEASTGREALDLVAGAELVVLDVNLPDISGIEVCRQIKDDAQTAAIPVIQVSATAVGVADRAHGLTEGADAYLIEPTEPTELLATVTAALRYHRARRRAELTASLLTALTSVTLDVTAARTFDGLARAAAAGAARIFGTEAVLILVQPDGQLRRTSAIPGQLVPTQRGGPVRMAERIAERVLGPGDTTAIARLPQEEWLQLVPDSTLRADVCLAVVRSRPDRPPVAIAAAQDGVPDAEEMQIQRQLALSVALSVEALRSYAEEHLIAMTLQRSFLPSGVPAIPGLSMSVRYIPASDQAEVGGDFYEAVTWRDKLLIAIGDVQGHSLHAATVMGEIRHALRAFATEGHPPLAITGLVNDVLRSHHPDVIATLCLAVLDPAAGDLELFNCGHMPPLIVHGEEARYFGQGGLMLGLPAHAAHVERTVLPPGATVLLFTDGLVEDRRFFLDDTMEKLRLAAGEASGTELEAFSNHLMALFGPREDDVAMIAVRRGPTP
ncbi:MAG: SpoIIE family protein phosphatase [Streptosporangiaceae bacterium]